VRPFPNTDSGHWQISSGGGTRPMWSRSGRELFYVAPAPNRLMRAAVELNRPSFVYDPPSALFDVADYAIGAIGRGFDLSRDDQRFLMVSLQSGGGGLTEALVVVANWFEELQARVRAR
jgi:hypothetical protein